MRRLLAPALLLAAACDLGLEPQYRVTDLRILAVRSQAQSPSDPASADVSLDDALVLEALVANPRARPGLRVSWFACAPELAGSLPPCLDPPFLRDPALLRAAAATTGSGVVEIPAGPGTGEAPPPLPLSALPQPAQDLYALALASAVSLATSQPTYQCRLYVEIPVVAVAEAEDRREVALKRVRLLPRAGEVPLEIQKYSLNLNPQLDGVFRAPANEDLCDGTRVEAADAGFPAGRTVLCGVANAAEFNVCGPEGERSTARESYSWQWYATGGEFPEFDGFGNATGKAVEFDRPGGPFTLWAILRDGRGGETWRTFEVAAPP